LILTELKIGHKYIRQRGTRTKYEFEQLLYTAGGQKIKNRVRKLVKYLHSNAT
jgi:hypothetical protein